MDNYNCNRELVFELCQVRGNEEILLLAHENFTCYNRGKKEKISVKKNANNNFLERICCSTVVLCTTDGRRHLLLNCHRHQNQQGEIVKNYPQKLVNRIQTKSTKRKTFLCEIKLFYIIHVCAPSIRSIALQSEHLKQIYNM